MPSNEIEIDRGKLHSDLDDVGDYLAELRYIDLAQQHIVQRNHEYAAAGTASGTNPIQVQLGTQPSALLRVRPPRRFPPTLLTSKTS